MATFLARELAENVTAADGYSALQKSVRRSNGQLARQVAALFHYRGYSNALFGRLFLIAVEDIGPAAPWLGERLVQYYEAWRNSLPDKKSKMSSKESKECAVELFKAVLSAVNAAKCRLNATLSACAIDRFDRFNVDEVLQKAPDFDEERDQRIVVKLKSEFQRHCARFVASSQLSEKDRMLSVMALWMRYRCEQGWIEKMSDAKLWEAFQKHLVPALLLGVEKRVDKKMRVECEKLMKLSRKAYKTFPNHLWIVHTVVHCCRDAPPVSKATLRPFAGVRIHSSLKKTIELNAFWSNEVKPFFSTQSNVLPPGPWFDTGKGAAPLPDWVYDKHTNHGRSKLKRGIEHFFNEGVKLAQPSGVDPEKVIEDYFFDDAKTFYLREEREKGTRATKSGNVLKRKSRAFTAQNSDTAVKRAKS